MAFTTIKTNQKTFLENYLRGTGKTLTARDAKARFGIQQLPARMSEMKSAGLNVCLLYTSPRPRDKRQSRMPSSA